MLHLDMIMTWVSGILNPICPHNSYSLSVRLQGEENIMLRKDRTPSDDDRGFIIFLICFILLFLSVMLYVRA